uniref:FAT domain-containing protein n=1 Tax=Trichuris muris TaxID=70415 RepID=A0A5S6Q6Z9_TRIMR
MQMEKAKRLKAMNETVMPLLQATVMISETEHSLLPPDSNAELFSIHCVIYGMLKQDERAEELFAYSSKINPNNAKNWKNWELHMQNAFLRNRFAAFRVIAFEVIVRLLNTGFSGSEWEMRKCLSTVFHLLHYDDKDSTLKKQFLPQLFDLLCICKFRGVVLLIANVAQEFPEGVLCQLQVYRSSSDNGPLDKSVEVGLENIYKHVLKQYPVLTYPLIDFSKRLISAVAREDPMKRLLR